jgi:hypothetical protein
MGGPLLLRRRGAARGGPPLGATSTASTSWRSSTRTAPASRCASGLLVLRFLKPVAGVDRRNVRIEGGVRVTGAWCAGPERRPPIRRSPPPRRPLATPHLAARAELRERILVVRTDSNGDYSTYRLTLSPPWPAGSAAAARLRSAPLGRRLLLQGRLPRAPSTASRTPLPAAELGEPEIGYLAKDYASFRRLMLDRLAAIAPDWRERNPADLGRRPGRAAGLRRRLALLLPGRGGHRGLPGHRARAPRCGVTPGWSTTSCTRERTPAPGSSSRATRRPTARSARPAPILRRPGRCSPPAAPGAGPARPAELPRRSRPGPLVFRDPVPARPCGSWANRFFYTWSDRECCLPAGATGRRSPPLGALGAVGLAQQGGLGWATSCSSRRCWDPRTGAAADADPRTGTWCG